MKGNISLNQKRKIDDRKIEQIKSQRKWKQIAKTINDPELEHEEEEEENFIKNIKEEGSKKFNKKLKNRYDEFGTEFTPFHMREEMDEGDIDDTGYFVYNKNKDLDPWYDSIKEKLKKKELDQAKVKNNKNESDEEIEENGNKEENIEDFRYYGEEDLYYKEEKVTEDELKNMKDEIKKYRIELLNYLVGEESVQQAINRLKPKVKPLNKPKRKKQKTEIEEIENKEEIQEKENKFKALLELISKLTELSYFNVYSDNYQKIEKDFGNFEIYKWKYRTTNNLNPDQLEIIEYGPFNSEEMKSWINQGYLNDTENIKFELKIINARDSYKDEWIQIDDSKVKEVLQIN